MPGPVTMSTIRTAAKALLDSLCVDVDDPPFREAFKVRPASTGSMPYAYVGDMRLDILHVNGLRQWSGELDLVVVDSVFDNEETEERLQTAAIAIADAATGDPHVLSEYTVSEPVRIRTGAETTASGSYPAVIVTVGRFVYVEGRR